MNALILKYFCFKKLIDKEPELIKEKLEYDDSLLFSLLSFKQSAMFYSKKDKYDIYNKLNNESFIDLIIESAINLSKENDYNQLLFLYSFVIDYYVDYYITPYLSIFAKDYSLCEACNMLDSIVANQNEFNISIPLSKQFKDAFKYYDYMDDLIHLIMIKLYNFFGSTNYFKIAYKKTKKFYKNYKAKINGINKKELKYPETYSTSILNKNKDEYEIYDKVLKYDLNEYINYINNIINRKIKSLNAYLFDNFKDDFIKEFNIPVDKKI